MRQSQPRSPRRSSSRGRTSSPARKRTRPLLTRTQAREATGVALIGLALLFFIAFAPVLRSAFGWGAPLVVVLVLGGGVYLIWPRAPQVRPLDVVALLAVTFAVLGLLALLEVGGGSTGEAISWWVASYVGPWGAGVIFGMALLLGLIVAFHFSPAATLGALAATARAAHAERQRIEALVRRAGPKAEGRPKAAPPSPAAATAARPEPVEVLAEPSFLDQLDEDLPDEPAAPPRQRPAEAEPAVAVMRVVADPLDDEPEIDWKLPGINLLETATARKERMQDEIKRNVRVIEHTLMTFGVEGKVIGVNPGPAVTQYEI
ncbi:MAG TPA: DNA translocase FtsK, partial [Candidatus Dormibacteraeota bacterium]